MSTIFIATVPFVYSDAAAAIASVPDRYVETAQTLGASSFQIVRKVLVALALPDIYNSLRHLFGLSSVPESAYQIARMVPCSPIRSGR